MLEPYEIIRFLFVEVGLQISMDKVHEFWDHYRGLESPWACHTSASREHIPLGIYGDAARIRQPAFAEVQKALGVFISLPLFRPRSIRMSRWLIWSIDEKHLFRNDTLYCALRRITWSVNLLFVGRYPQTNAYGQPFDPELAGKEIIPNRRFAVTELRGDQLWHKQVWKFRASWKGGVNESTCHLCETTNAGRLAYYRVHEGNEIPAEYSLCEFINKQLPQHDVCTLG